MTASHKKTHHWFFSLSDNFSHKLCALTHHIFPGSRPWYIRARMRHDGLRIVTVFSYLEKHKMGMTDDKNDSKLNGLQTLDFVSTNYSLFLFLLDVLILGISSLILECWAVIYKLLDDFLWSTHIDILSNRFAWQDKNPNNASPLKCSLICLYRLISTKPSDSYLYVLKEHFTPKYKFIMIYLHPGFTGKQHWCIYINKTYKRIKWKQLHILCLI